MEVIVGGRFELHLVMNNGNQAVTDNRCVALDSDCVFGVSPELIDLQMLLHPFEEQLNGPTGGQPLMR